MKISTKGVYAMEIVADLALHAGEEQKESLGNIARRRGLSEKYLERIIKALKEKGIVESVRGARGGYRLLVPPEQLTARMVLQAVEGPLAPVGCLTGETDCQMDCNACPTRPLWQEMWDCILDAADQVTVAHILAEAKREEKRGIDRTEQI